MDTTQLRLNVTNRSEFHNLGIELWIDSGKFFDSNIAPGTAYIVHEFTAEDDTEHVLKIVLKGKCAEHTKINDAGEVVSDALIKIDNISFDDIAVDPIVYNLSEYVHDGNGNETIAVHKFYGDMGCNGYVKLAFRTPVYLWLLENM